MHHDRNNMDEYTILGKRQKHDMIAHMIPTQWRLGARWVM